MSATALPTQPRPLLQRPGWTELDGSWRFCYDDGQRFLQPSDVTDWPLQIRVPFPPESLASGIGDTGFHPCCWYERDFELAIGSGRVILRFSAVDDAAKVWLNGRLAVTHEGATHRCSTGPGGAS